MLLRMSDFTSIINSIRCKARTLIWIHNNKQTERGTITSQVDRQHDGKVSVPVLTEFILVMIIKIL